MQLDATVCVYLIIFLLWLPTVQAASQLIAYNGYYDAIQKFSAHLHAMVIIINFNTHIVIFITSANQKRVFTSPWL